MESFITKLNELIQILHDANTNNILSSVLDPALELKYQLQKMDEFYAASRKILEKK